MLFLAWSGLWAMMLPASSLQPKKGKTQGKKLLCPLCRAVVRNTRHAASFFGQHAVLLALLFVSLMPRSQAKTLLTPTESTHPRRDREDTLLEGMLFPTASPNQCTHSRLHPLFSLYHRQYSRSEKDKAQEKRRHLACCVTTEAPPQE